MGANNADFNADAPKINIKELTFTVEHTPDQIGEYTIKAHHPTHGHVGSMILNHPSDGTPYRNGQPNPKGTRAIKWVESFHKRQGIATAMWNHAKSLGLKPAHSTQLNETSRPWAEKVGN